MSQVAVVAAQWHADLVERMVQAFVPPVRAAGHEVEVLRVPGSFEIPFQVRRLARSGGCAAVAACGLVVDGGIYRHDFVAATVVDALMRVQLECDVPVLSGVLAPHHFHEHADHLAFFDAHLVGKGEELARSCLAVLPERPR